MSTAPRTRAIDSTFLLFRDGYEFIWKRCQRFGSDVFQTRLLGKKAVCMHGHDAAMLFYDEGKMERAHAAPRRMLTTLLGTTGVQTLDGERHRQRKSAFTALMTKPSLEQLMDLTAQRWREAIRRWEKADQVVLFDEAARVLTESVCIWAGVPLSEDDAGTVTRRLVSMIDGAGGVGPRLWRGKLARLQSELWAARTIRDVRTGRLHVAPGSAAFIMAHHQDEPTDGTDGRSLPVRTAAIELLNVIRPTTAVAWYIAFAALSLQAHPEWRERLAHEPFGEEGAGELTDLFAQEVRRYYPFFPFAGAKARTPFDWHGQHFGKGTLVLLDLYGANLDPTLWSDPEVFRPERFREWDGNAFDFIPHGGGSVRDGHRCPGEWITMHNVALALHFLTRCMTYDVVPGQDLAYDFHRMPTRPRSGVVVRNVRATAVLNGPAPRLPSTMAARAASRFS
jgi:fatty-acid peroxygenase